MSVALHFTNICDRTEEFHTYIANNQTFIISYGERYRQGDRISSGFVESTVNYVVVKRFAKRQQMQWSPEGCTFTFEDAHQGAQRRVGANI